jgi:RNA polymerase sigma-70 factor (ECF subfamily)
VSPVDLATVLADNGADARGSFAALVERYGPHMYRLAFRLTGNEQDAKDVVQESLMRAYRGLDRFEGRADPGTWFHRIVVNCSLDLMRTVRSRPDRQRPEPLRNVADAIPSTAANPERLAASGELRRQIASALEQLTPLERAAFTLRHFEERSIDEIARILGIRGNAAKQHIFRAVRKLRAALDIQRSGQ